mmetsp:Transcript_7388/g.13761  ORF Transcript_7388/g.13761 Transcript_7388/m.13761 type:complete len:187 (+) Transcript_7388:3255-3815(+)
MRRDTEHEQDRLLTENQPPLKYMRTAKQRVVEAEVSSSLWLQVFVYFNRFYSPLMFVILLGTYVYKELYFKSGFSIASIFILFAWGILEWVRLHYGFSGNIKENFSELIAFMILTVVFCTPLLATLFIIVTRKFPIDNVVPALQAVFYIFEFFLCISAIRRLVVNQTAIFYLRNSKPDLYFRVTST